MMPAHYPTVHAMCACGSEGDTLSGASKHSGGARMAFRCSLLRHQGSILLRECD